MERHVLFRKQEHHQAAIRIPSQELLIRMLTAFHLELLFHHSNQLIMGHRQQVIHNPVRHPQVPIRHHRDIILLRPINLALRTEHQEALNLIHRCNQLMELLKDLSRMVLQLLLAILQFQTRSLALLTVTLQLAILLQDHHRLIRMDNIVHLVRLNNSIRDMNNHATLRTSHPPKIIFYKVLAAKLHPF